MYFLTYLRREMRRRMRQAVFIALGLALGIGLVITVTAASAGVKNAQADVLRSLYGVGTDVTVSGKAPQPPSASKGGGQLKVGTEIKLGPNGPEICQNGKCRSAAGQTINMVGPGNAQPFSQSKVASVAGLAHVKSAAGGLALIDNTVKFPKNFGQGSAPPLPNSVTLDGVDTSRLSLGPLSAATVTSGRSLRSSDANAHVAVLDSGYATAHKLKIGSKLKIDGQAFRVVGIVAQPSSGSPTDAYIPLARAQALSTGSGKTRTGEINTIYVTADNAADIPAVQHEITKLLPGYPVTTASSLASDITGSVSNTARLANDLGKWLSIVVLIAAFAVAGLLTMAAVARRVRDFGTLKALGWRSRRIIAQVMGESMAVGLIGGAAGVGLGFAGTAIISAIAPLLSATLSSPTGQRVVTGGPGGSQSFTPTNSHTVLVPLTASVSAGAIILGVVLAVVGGLLAGSFGSWRIARLRPAQALARVA